MSSNISLPKSCFCISLKTASALVGIGGLLFGLLFFIQFLQLGIRHEVLEGEHPHKQTYELVKDLTFMYPDTLKIMFSICLVYGTFKDYPTKTCFISTWLIYQLVALTGNIINGILLILQVDVAFWIEELILIGIQLASMYTVYCYYHCLPKQNIHNS